jgi:hypothetical protein
MERRSAASVRTPSVAPRCVLFVVCNLLDEIDDATPELGLLMRMNALVSTGQRPGGRTP